MLVSIMAKKVATGITHLVIDIPYGPNTKIPNQKVAWHIRDKFIYLSRRFGIRTKVVLTEAREPIGRGIGPSLEARDVLRVLQQKDYRPTDLEQKSVKLAGKLLELCGTAREGEGEIAARESLAAGWAWKKMQGIIKSQGGNPHIDSEDLTLGAKRQRFHAPINGVVRFVNNKAIDDVARILGAPHEKPAGLYINKRIGQKVRKGERIFTLYAQSEDRIRLAAEALKKTQIIKISRF
jgi:AMP phosphorylase